ncbi:hypothetical protein L208DRAFT_1145604, partial [Tricholoma matsutake]
MKIHGLKANVLLDLGCTADSVSPEFTVLANIKVHKLIEPVPLQLGMVGSRSKINFGLFAEFELRTVKADHYFDVINLNRYDAIMGTVFMRNGPSATVSVLKDPNQLGLSSVSAQPPSRGWASMTMVEERDVDRPQKGQGLGEWLEICKDILRGVPERPPPMREINHQIPLVDEKRRYNYHLPKCLDSMRQPLADKIERCCWAGWWRPARTEQAALMLVVPKKNGDICTVVNVKKRNDNTVKNVMPFPDQDLIRLDIARAKY